MKIVWFTKADNTGGSIYLNADKIISFQAYQNGTLIILSGQFGNGAPIQYAVTETPAQVKSELSVL